VLTFCRSSRSPPFLGWTWNDINARHPQTLWRNGLHSDPNYSHRKNWSMNDSIVGVPQEVIQRPLSQSMKIDILSPVTKLSVGKAFLSKIPHQESSSLHPFTPILISKHARVTALYPIFRIYPHFIAGLATHEISCKCRQTQIPSSGSSCLLAIPPRYFQF
jgi:hypothetical protein